MIPEFQAFCQRIKDMFLRFTFMVTVMLMMKMVMMNGQNHQDIRNDNTHFWRSIVKSKLFKLLKGVKTTLTEKWQPTFPSWPGLDDYDIVMMIIMTLYPHNDDDTDDHLCVKRSDPSLWGLSICTVDGQRYSLGDHYFHCDLSCSLLSSWSWRWLF